MRIAGDGLTAVKAAASVRYGTSGAYQQTQWKTGSPDGSCFVNAALVTGKVGGLATVSPGSRVWRVEVRYQSHDRRFVRGTRGVTKQED